MTRQNVLRGLALTAAAAAFLPLMAMPAQAQNKPAPSGTVLVFPAVVDGTKGDSAKLVTEIVTDALRSRLKTQSISVVVYSGKLPSIQRAREEQQVAKADADAGPGDDRRKALNMATIVGADEYLSVFVDSYAYNATSRTATFNLNVNRYDAKDGSPLGTFNKQVQGVAPADVAAFRQEGSAIARAMDAGAEQSLNNLYPALPILDKAQKGEGKNKGRGGDRQVVLGFGAAMAALFFSTR